MSFIFPSSDNKAVAFHFDLDGGGAIIVTVLPDGGCSSGSSNLKEVCRFCGKADCGGDCEDALEMPAEDIHLFAEERRCDICYNFAIDGVEAMVMQLCCNGLVTDENIDKITACINEAVRGAANNI